MRKRDPAEKKRKPSPLGDVVTGFLKQSGLEERVEQALVIPEWEKLVGFQIAAVTKPLFVTADGTLFVAVKNNGWMTELSLMEPQLLRALNAKAEGEGETEVGRQREGGPQRVRKIRLQLMR